MTMLTSARDGDLCREIAEYIELLASDCEAFAARGMSKRNNIIRAKAYRSIAEDIRSIKVVVEVPE